MQLSDLSLFALAALVMVLTPGPNMVYLISRSLCQGPKAGIVSLAGVVLGFVLHVLMAAFGISAFFLAVPLAYDALRFAGAAYLLWLAWQAIRTGSKGVFEVKELKADSSFKLVWMGFLTNALNPKIAIFYISIFTQFLDPNKGSIFAQSVTLGIVQICVSAAVNAAIVFSAAMVYAFFSRNPTWTKIQKWVMASALSGLALKLAVAERK